MTPLDIIRWALAIGIAWLVLSTCIPFERWISSLIKSVAMRRKVFAPDNPDHCDLSGDRWTLAAEVLPDDERNNGRSRGGTVKENEGNPTSGNQSLR